MNSTRSKFFLKSGVILAVVSFLSSVINYVFQAAMGRMLPLEEFGYLNTTLGIIMLVGVPIAAASQTIAHYLARLRAEGDADALRRFRLGSQCWLRRATFGIAFLSVILWLPAKEYLNFPRHTLALAALICLPAQLWNQLAAAWCAGMERFQLLGLLNLGNAVVRLTVGAIFAWQFTNAEAGVWGAFAGACLVGSVLFFQPKAEALPDEEPPGKIRKEFLLYLCASISIGIANFLFFQGDQILAQKSFSPKDLGYYSAAGLLGRAVVWGSLPFLTVYFTQRSGVDSTNNVSWRLKVLYLLSLVCGVAIVISFRDFLSHLLLGRHEPQAIQWMDDFATVMLMVGFLQAIGFFYLATRRFIECFVFGTLGIIYFIILSQNGKEPHLMLQWMLKGTGGAIIILLLLSLFKLSRTCAADPEKGAT